MALICAPNIFTFEAERETIVANKAFRHIVGAVCEHKYKNRFLSNTYVSRMINIEMQIFATYKKDSLLTFDTIRNWLVYQHEMSCTVYSAP